MASPAPGNPIQKAAGHRVTVFQIPYLAFVIPILIGLTLILFRFSYCVAFIGITLPIERFILHREPHPIRACKAWWRVGRHAYDAGPRYSHRGLRHAAKRA